MMQKNLDPVQYDPEARTVRRFNARAEMREQCEAKARERAERRLIDLLYPGRRPRNSQAYKPLDPNSGDEPGVQ